MGILLEPWRVNSVGEGRRKAEEEWGGWRMEDRRWVGEDAIEEEKDAWEVVRETGWGGMDKSENRGDKMMTLRVELLTASS